MEPKTVRRAGGAIRSARHVAPESAMNALVAGTVVLTLDGALPVEYLNEGDRVITRDSGTAVVRSVHRTKRTLPMVGIKLGTLGNNKPDRDALLPASQEILVRDWRAQALFGSAQALVPVARLLDGEFIHDLGEMQVETVELGFGTPHIIYADGLELATSWEPHKLAL